MGLHVYTSFQTPEGFTVSDVYCRIVECIYRHIASGRFIVTIRTETYLNRESRLGGRTSIRVPGISDVISYDGTFGDMTMLYASLKTILEEAGFTVEDVDPDPQPPAPTEPPTEPPAPTEPPTEPPAPTEPPTEPPAE